MRRSIWVFAILLVTGIFILNFAIYQADAHKPGSHKPTPKPTPRPTPKPSKCSAVEQQLDQCNADLNSCNDELVECQSQSNYKFPGDGYHNPDLFRVSGHGPALTFTDNGDGTFTDNNTGLMWEIKEFAAGGVHDVSNTYTWSLDSGVISFPGSDNFPTGTLFTKFLDTLNNKCDGDETTACTSNTDCSGIGNGLCGHAGYRDWRIPNVKEFISILYYDFGRTSAYGIAPYSPFSAAGDYWSATSYGGFPLRDYVYIVSTLDGIIKTDLKHNSHRGMAVRP